jgi:hypothetical protein
MYTKTRARREASKITKIPLEGKTWPKSALELPSFTEHELLWKKRRIFREYRACINLLNTVSNGEVTAKKLNLKSLESGL